LLILVSHELFEGPSHYYCDQSRVRCDTLPAV